MAKSEILATITPCASVIMARSRQNDRRVRPEAEQFAVVGLAKSDHRPQQAQVLQSRFHVECCHGCNARLIRGSTAVTLSDGIGQVAGMVPSEAAVTRCLLCGNQQRRHGRVGQPERLRRMPATPSVT